MRSDKLLLALAVVCLLLTLRCPAHAAPQWNVITVTGTGGQTSEYTTVAICDSTHWLEIERRATTLTNKVTLNTVTGAGAVTRTDVTPSSPTTMSKLLAVGCDATTILVGGQRDWIRSATIADPTTWSNVVDGNNATNAFTGVIAKTSTDKTWRVWDVCGTCTTNRLLNFSIAWSVGNVAGSVLLGDEQEQVSVSVASGFEAAASVTNATGQSYFRVYSSGTSFVATSQESSASANPGSYYRQPFGQNATLGAFTIKRQSNSQIYIRWINSSGTITNLNTGSTTDLRPLGDWDPTGSLRRGWWVGAADGKLYASNSAGSPTSVANNATYDMGATALQSSTPILGFTTQYNGSVVGIDINQDGVSGDPVVLLANKGLAYYGEPPVTSSPSRPKPQRAGPFNNLPFRGP